MKNKKFLIIFLIFIIVILVVSAILRIITPKEIAIPETQLSFQNQDKSSSEFSQVAYSGPAIEIPDQFSIGQISEQSQIETEHIKNKIIQAFDLKAHPQSKKIWQSNNFYLNYQEEEQQYILLNQQLSSQVPTVGINSQKAEQVALEFINQNLADLAIYPQSKQIKFYASLDEFYQTVDAAQAKLAIIPFSYHLDNYPVFYQQQSSLPFEVYLDSQYQIRKLVFSPSFYQQIKQLGFKKSLSLEQAIDNINQQNQAAIISYFRGELGPELNLSQIKSADLKQVKIEYRIDEESKLVYPFYKFIGSAQTSNDTLEVEIITPAITTSPQ